MAARYTQEEIERQRNEQGERFLKQLGDMFAQTRVDLAQQFMPRPEAESRMNHLDQVVESIGTAMEKLTGNVSNFHENAPRIYADRAETKADLAEMRTEIEKIKTKQEADKEKQYGYRVDDLGRVYQGEAGIERGWRTNTQQQNAQVINYLIQGMIMILSILISVMLARLLG